MKINQFIKLFAIVLLLATTACKKYGYNIPDGYPDNSANIATGTIDTNLKLIDKSKYAQAKVFPGLVDQSEPRVKDAKFTLDLNYSDQTTDVLRISVAPEPQFSTGYYAAPGELVKIVVPPGIEGLVVQIGGQTDNLNGKTPLLRDPVIYMRQQLYAGNNYVRNLYGGTIYIRAGHSYLTPIEFTISNAVVSPDFVLNTSTDVAWIEQVKASKVPWLELRTKRVVFLIPRDRVINSFSSAKPFNNPTAVLTNWNEVFDRDFNSWMGLSDNAPDKRDRSPQGPWRGVLDIQLSAGYGHNGFPFVGLNDSEWFGGMTSLNLNGAWGTYHEFGHNMQQGRVWSWSTLGETTNNLFNFKVANRRGTSYSILHGTDWVAPALAFAAQSGSKNFDGTDVRINDPFARMIPFIQIFDQFGYDAMTYLYTQARYAERLNSSDIVMHNFVYEKLSDYTRKDLGAFFDAWGILTSQTVRDKVMAKYPLITTQIWTYNIMTKTGGTAAIPVQTYPFIYSISSSQSGDGDPNSLIDGVISNASYWHSNYGTATPTNTTGFPISIVIKTGALPIPIKGMTFAQRQNNNGAYAKDVEVFTSNDAVNYTSVGTTTLPQSITRYDYIFTGGVVNARYVKVVIKNGLNATYTNLSECNIIKP